MQRLRPVIPETGRTLAVDKTIGDRTFHAGTSLTPSILLAHRDAATHAQPDVFDPDRASVSERDRAALVPFGGGVRRCLGAAFATVEMRVVIETVFRTCRLHPARRRLERPQRRAITLMPKHGTRVLLDGRSV